MSCLAGRPQDLPWFPLLSPEVLRVSQHRALCSFTGTEETRHLPAGGQWQRSHHRLNCAKNHQEQVGFLCLSILLHIVLSSSSES